MRSAQASPRALVLPLRAAALALLSACLGACASGVGGETMEPAPAWDAAVMLGDGGGRGIDASDAAGRDDAAAHDAASSDASQPADASQDTSTPTQEAGSQPDEAGVDAAPEDTGMVTIDSGADADAGVEPDAAPSDTGAPDVTPPAPVNCSPIVRTGVQLCDMSADHCGAVFNNTSGCTATCAAAGLACASAYENVENQCARDDTRPALPCDSGHISDYCLCRRP
jgi:hypothetical protein